MASFVFIWSITFFQRKNVRCFHDHCNFCGTSARLESFDGFPPRVDKEIKLFLGFSASFFEQDL